MNKFEVLPTDPTFQALSDMQIDMILYSMEEDFRAQERAMKGFGEEEGYDTEFEEEVWDRAVGDWEVLKEGHDPDSIAKQINALTKEEDKKNLYSKFDSLDEYNAYLEAGGKTTRESEVEQYIDKQLKIAEEKARTIEADKERRGKRVVNDNAEAGEQLQSGLSELRNEDIRESISSFESLHDDDDDDYTIIG